MNKSIIVPQYFWPSAHPESWNAVIAAATYVGLLVFNPDSGPGTSRLTEFSDAVQRCQTAGIKVMGYVDSAYGNRDIAAVKADIDNYKAWYSTDGYFIDDMYTDDTAEVPYYTQIHDYVKGISQSQQLILNPGQPVMPEAYMNLSDVFVSFEGSAQSYITFTPAAYTNNYASSKFWHIVYGCDTDATINSTLQQFDQQHAEWLYMTDLLEPNPYDNLAGNATWTAELNYMAKHTSVGSGAQTTWGNPVLMTSAILLLTLCLPRMA